MGFFDEFGNWLTFGIDFDMCIPACLILFFGFPAELLVRIFWLEGTLDKQYLLYYSFFPITFYHFWEFGTSKVQAGSGGPVFDDFNTQYMQYISIFIHILINYACTSRRNRAARYISAFIVTPFLIFFMILNVALSRVYRKLNDCPQTDENGNVLPPNYSLGYPVEQGIEMVGMGYIMYSLISFFSRIWTKIGMAIAGPMMGFAWTIVPIPFIITNAILIGLSFFFRAINYIPGLGMGFTFLFMSVFLNMWENTKADRWNNFCTNDGEIWNPGNFGRMIFALLLGIVMTLFSGMIGTGIGLVAFIIVMVRNNA